MALLLGSISKGRGGLDMYSFVPPFLGCILDLFECSWPGSTDDLHLSSISFPITANEITDKVQAQRTLSSKPEDH